MNYIFLFCIVVINCIPAYGILELGWRMGTVFMVFWLELFIVWFFAIARYLNAKYGDHKDLKTHPAAFPMLGDMLTTGLYLTVSLYIFFDDYFMKQMIPSACYFLAVSFVLHGILGFADFLSGRGYDPALEKILRDMGLKRGIFVFLCFISIAFLFLYNSMKDLPLDTDMDQTLLVSFIALKGFYEIFEFIYKAKKPNKTRAQDTIYTRYGTAP